MNQLENDNKPETGQQTRACGVDDSFNFIVGGIAFVAAILIAYAVYRFWI